MAQPRALRAAALLCLASRGGLALDAGALVQAQLRTHSAAGAAVGSKLLHSRQLKLAAAQAPQLPDAETLAKLFPAKPFDCSKFPFMCQAPFDCQTPNTYAESVRSMKTLATVGGQPDLHSWCGAPQYADNVVQKCLVEKDLKAAGRAVFAATAAGRYGPTTLELDASYCFLEGHCSNEAVTENTTLEEAAVMCDARYGHDAWAKDFGIRDLFRVQMDPNLTTPHDGFKSAAATAAFLKAACAMGNYHCDVMYCKETYCKVPYFAEKYGHLLPKTPGHLIRSTDANL